MVINSVLRTVPLLDAVPFPSINGIKRFTLDQYRRMVEIGIFGPEDRCELLLGWLVTKMTKNPPHSFSSSRLHKLLIRLLSDDWCVRNADPIELAATESSPEPDMVVAIGPDTLYSGRHPSNREVALLVEVSDSSLEIDRTVKLQIYAQDRIAVYWIVNLTDRQIEVYTLPRGGKQPTYRKREDFLPGSSVPVVLNSEIVGSIEVDAILPKED